MQRRDLVLGAAGGAACAMLAGAARASALPSALPVPAAGFLHFKLLRNNVPIGEYHMQFTQAGDQLRIDINTAAVVRMMGIVLHSYQCTATEYWSGGQFAGLDSQVNDNGAALEVHARPIPGGFAIRSTRAGNYDYTGKPGLMPLTYWNKAMLNAMILNINTGRHYPAIVKSPGWFYVPTEEGGKLLAQRFDVTGKLHISLWYDQFSQWDGLAFNLFGEITFVKYTA